MRELAAQLIQAATSLRDQIPETIAGSVLALLRLANCYYSNRIEGHSLNPFEIERAVQGNFSSDSPTQDLQLEAAAHITVQEWIDQGGLAGRATTVHGIQELHRRFATKLPDSLRLVRQQRRGEPTCVDPGSFRQRDVAVGRHRAISPGAIPRFMARFQTAFSQLGHEEAIVSAGAAHHRLLWIHPFLDGNGRVARLVSHASFVDVLGTALPWPISRGIAINEDRYRELLGNCDLRRRNDLDGRGHLSQEALVAFTRYFLQTCLVEVQFMTRLVRLDVLVSRARNWAKQQIVSGRLASDADRVVETLLRRTNLTVRELPRLLDISDSAVSAVLQHLTERGMLISASPSTALQLRIPVSVANDWVPGLLPYADSR